MKKLSTISIFSLMILLLLATIFGGKVFAVELDRVDLEKLDKCGKVYEVDADEDKTTHLAFADSGNKVDIVFNDTDGSAPSDDDHNQVIVTAGSGYEIVNVQYELEHYSGIGWVTVPGTNPTTTITLAGLDDDSRIDEVEVKLKEVCVTPTPTDSLTPTVTPTQTGTQNIGGPGDGLSDGRSDGRSDGGSTGGSVLGASTAPYQAVLGASTMAKTGSFEQNLMNLSGILGVLFVAAGYLSRKKERNA